MRKRIFFSINKFFNDNHCDDFENERFHFAKIDFFVLTQQFEFEKLKK